MINRLLVLLACPNTILQPAIKILEFFRHLADEDIGFSTDNLQRLSPTVQELEPLGQAHADAWISYWKRKGLFA